MPVLVGLAASRPAVAQSLEEASASALEQSFVLRADKARQDATDARLRGAIDAFMPKVGVVIDRPLDSRFTYAPQVEPIQVGLDATPRRAPDQFGLTAELPLFDGFQRWNNLKSARTLSEAGRFITLSQRQQVLLDTAVAYIAVLRDTRILAAREAQVVAIRRIHEATARQFEFNDATRTDVALTLSRVQEAEASRERARIELAAARLELKRLTRIEPERMVPPRLPDQLPRSEDAYADLVLANNPALAAARLDAQSAQEQAQASVGALLPKVDLQFGHLAQSRYSPALDRLTDTTTRVIARMPLYEPGAFPKIAEASAIARQRGYEAQDEELTRVTAARTAYAKRAGIVAQLARLIERVGYLRATMRGFEIERGAGFRTVLDELNIRSELADAEVAAAAVTTERDALSLQLAAAIGQLDVGTSVPASRRFDPLPVPERTAPLALRGSGSAPVMVDVGPVPPEAAAPALRGSKGGSKGASTTGPVPTRRAALPVVPHAGGLSPGALRVSRAEP